LGRILVIGLDGISPELLDLLAEKEIFTNISSLIDGGIRGELESTFPYNTWPAWTSFATGVYPGKHGIFNWGLPGKSFLINHMLSLGVKNVPLPMLKKKPIHYH